MQTLSQHHSMTLYMRDLVSLWCVLALIQCTDTAPESSAELLADGVVVVRDAEMRARTADWTLYVTISEPRPSPGFETTLTQLQTMIETVNEYTLTPENLKLSWKLRMDSLGAKSKRTKRGLLDFVGKVSHFLFGTATEQQIRETQTMIKQAEKSQQVLFHSMKELASVINKTRQFVQENRGAINDLMQHVSKMDSFISNFTKIQGDNVAYIQYAKATGQINTILITLELVHEFFEEQQHIFHQQRLALERGQLTEDVLPPLVLTEVLNQAKIFQRIGLTNQEWYYQYLPITPIWREDSQLVYKVIIPLVDDVTYLRYVIHSWPIPYNQTGFAIQLVLANNEFGLDTQRGGMFIPSHCIGKYPAICETGPIFNEEDLLCVRAIINDHSRVSKDCTMDISKQSSSAKISRVSPNQYILVTWGETVTTRCPGLPQIIDKFGPGCYLLSVQDSCTVQGNTWTLVGLKHHYAQTTWEHKTMTLPKLNLTVAAPIAAVSDYFTRFNISKLGEIKGVRIADILPKTDQMQTINWARHGGHASWGVIIVIIIVLIGLGVMLIYKRKWCIRTVNNTRKTLAVHLPTLGRDKHTQPQTSQTSQTQKENIEIPFIHKPVSFAQLLRQAHEVEQPEAS